jgi:hypothetical protein
MKMPGNLACSLLAGIAAAFLVMTNARAQDPGAATPSSAPAPAPVGWRGLYLGGGGIYSNVSVKVDDATCYYDCYWGDYDNYDEGDGAFGYSLHAGLRVHRYVALEVSYLQPGTIRWDKDLVYMPEFNDYYNNRVDFEATVTEVSVLGILPFDDMFEIYVRLGAGFWEGQSTQRLDESFGDTVVTRVSDDEGTDLLLGVGAGVTFAKAFHVRLDLQTVGIDEDVLNARDDTSLDSILLEVQYRFGAH